MEIVELDLSDGERAQLENSADAVRETLAAVAS